MRKAKIFDFVSAPAPRYLMRLALIEHLIEKAPQNLRCFLEIGPGLGDVSSYVRNCYPKAQGVLVDFSKEGAVILNKRFEADKGVKVLCTDFSKHHFSSRFGLIMAFEVLEHVEDDVGALKKIAQHLDPCGIFLFSAPAFMRKWQRGDEYAGHIRRYEREEIVRKFFDAGLAVETIWCFGFPVTQLLYPFREAYYSWYLATNPREKKEDATKRSGIERPLFHAVRKFPISVFIRPFLFLQELAKHTNIGDGFLVMARKVR